MPPVMRAPAPNPLRPHSGILGAIGDFLLGSNPTEEMQSALAPSASIITDPLKSVLAKELAERVYNNFKGAGFDNVARAVGDIFSSPRHSAIVSTLRDAGSTLETELLGSYDKAAPSALRAALKRNPVLLHMSPAMAKNANEEFITRLATSKYGGRIGINASRLENDPIAETYKVARHELSHAADNLSGKSIGPSTEDIANSPRYWVNLAEVRARASEPNYVRDMTGKADSSDLLRRPRYVDKMIKEIQEGRDLGTGKAIQIIRNRIGPNASDVPEDLQHLIPDLEKELSNTVSHYFGPTLTKHHTLAPGDISFTTDIKATPPRLAIPRQSINPRRPSYDWEQLIRPNVETASGLSGPSARAYEDLLARLRGRE